MVDLHMLRIVILFRFKISSGLLNRLSPPACQQPYWNSWSCWLFLQVWASTQKWSPGMCFFCAWNCASRNKARKTNKSTVKPAAFVLTGFLPPASSAVAFHTRVRRNSAQASTFVACCSVCMDVRIGGTWNLAGVVFLDRTIHRESVTRSLCVIFQLKQSDLGQPVTGQTDKYVKASLTLQSSRKGRLVFLPSKRTWFTVQTAHAARCFGQREGERESWLTGFTSRLPLLWVHTHSCHLVNYIFFLWYEGFALSRAPSGNNGECCGTQKN